MAEHSHDLLTEALPGLSAKHLSAQPAGTLLRMLVRVGLALCLRIGQVCRQGRSRFTERRALRQLDAHLLRDIGLSKHEADQETGKWFWEG